MATRCCCPPERLLGYLFACSGMPTLFKSFSHRASASLLETFLTFVGASLMFSATVL